MMKFSTLWSLDRTVDPASGRSPIADSIAANWEHDTGSVRFFRSSANFIYTLDRHGRRAYLRIAESSERSAQTIANELAIISCLRSAGLSVVQPIPARSGDLVISQDTGAGGMHAVLFDSLVGRHRELDELSIADMDKWGATVGQIHVALKAVHPH